MLDFYTIKERSTRNGIIEIYPDFRVCRSKDLMVRGRSFYAIWDEEVGLWSTDEYDVQRLVDIDLARHAEEVKKRNEGVVRVKYMGDFSSKVWMDFQNYVKNLSDSSVQLDEKLTFSNTEVKKSDYVSRRLPYPLAPGSIEAYDELIGTLYDPQERAKLEWAIGAIVAGDAKNIQKFVVLYGSAGTGKSTFLEIVQKLFAGYYTTFEAKALTSSSNSFSTEVFRSNPLIAIQHDGDLSRIEDNSKLNSIVSHEEMTMNVKFKPSYMSRINAFLFMGTNKPVKITDSRSGIIRRLIDVQPTGNRVDFRRYQTLYSQLEFELGAIAYHCLQTYLEMGKSYYDGYKPVDMMMSTDVFFNYIEYYYDILKEEDAITLTRAYDLYKRYIEESAIEWRLPRHRFRDELKSYYHVFEDRGELNGERVRSLYSGFKTEVMAGTKEKPERPRHLILDQHDSILDGIFRDRPAQYANDYEVPSKKWDTVESVLGELDTTKLHYVQPPLEHIVIDFDLKDEDGNKSAELNLEAANEWPPTYAEFSKGGAGVHLHYLYAGDVEQLSRIYSEDIEIKVFVGNSSLRRRLSLCNNVPVATLTGGLPLKEKKMINDQMVKSEKGLRDLIERNLKKEIHPGTKPSMDFIHKILNDAYDSGLPYDLEDMRPRLVAFANNSTNQALYCLKLIKQLKLKSEVEGQQTEKAIDDRLAIFDVEVFPNLFTICWKFEGAPDSSIVKMINPEPNEIEQLMRLRLVGFNCRRYDNHILYGRYMGYSNKDLYELSKKIIGGERNALFGEAYNISYADIYDFSTKKQGLKKWQLELGIRHHEIDIPWDEDVPEDKIPLVLEYNANDVTSTEAVFNARKQDFVARKVLAKVSGMPVNATTQQHTGRIIFGDDRRPQEKFNYTHLAEMFEGYKYDAGTSTYRGEVTGEGGYVYAEPGMYKNVAVLDIESMHPTSIIELDLFGPYTKNFKELLQARLAIKHAEYDKAKKMLGGSLEPYLHDVSDAEALDHALKIVINSVYGLTSARFPNLFKDNRNVDNIVAKRGALFMVDLKNAVIEQGYTVAHIKTDSIKIPDATPEIIDFVMEFGKDFGYTFDHEATFDRFALVNDAVFIAKVRSGRKPEHWDAVGAQFQHPFVFKTLFSKEPIEFDDLIEIKTVTTDLYLDFAEGRKDESKEDRDARRERKEGLMYVGRAGAFVPVVEGGGDLLREKNGKYYFATGSKGHQWKEAALVNIEDWRDVIDWSYYNNLANEAVNNISKFGDFEWLTSD